jgi:hypothetical protein
LVRTKLARLCQLRHSTRQQGERPRARSPGNVYCYMRTSRPGKWLFKIATLL